MVRRHQAKPGPFRPSAPAPKRATGTTESTVGIALVGSYGSLTLKCHGSYLYVVDNAITAVPSLAPRPFVDRGFHSTR
ncbi:MAG: hypothetical protein IPN78_10355 [Candidatus Accumulibacter sp.]|nr:hypothetical protein [Candidatus Accumulibacter propinquus]